jgi:hypothetical protein
MKDPISKEAPKECECGETTTHCRACGSEDIFIEADKELEEHE